MTKFHKIETPQDLAAFFGEALPYKEERRSKLQRDRHAKKVKQLGEFLTGEA